MASTSTEQTLAKKIDGHIEKTPFVVNATSADWSGGEVVMAAPGTGKTIVVEEITAVCATALTTNIGQGEAGGAIDPALITALEFTTDGQSLTYKFKTPVMIAENSGLAADASASGRLTFVVKGFILG